MACVKFLKNSPQKGIFSSHVMTLITYSTFYPEIFAPFRAKIRDLGG